MEQNTREIWKSCTVFFVAILPERFHQQASPFADGNGTRFQLWKMAAALQIPRVFTRGSSYESAKAIQSHIPGLKLTNKVGKSRAMPAYLPGVTPPPPRMTADKCIMHYHYALSVCNVSVKSKLQHAPSRAYPGHLTPLPSRGGGNLIIKVFQGVGNLIPML